MERAVNDFGRAIVVQGWRRSLQMGLQKARRELSVSFARIMHTHECRVAVGGVEAAFVGPTVLPGWLEDHRVRSYREWR